MVISAKETYLRLPGPGIFAPGHPLNTRRIVGTDWHVIVILTMRYTAQVTSSIIKFIPIYMIHFKAPGWLHDNSVEKPRGTRNITRTV